MPDDLKISDMTPITGANLAADDVFPVVDISTNTNRSIVWAEVLSGMASAEQTLVNKTIVAPVFDSMPSYYGATGDGVADDTAELNAWLASGVPLHAPPDREYMISGTITMPDDVTITGHLRILWGGALTATPFVAGDDVSVERFSFRIANVLAAVLTITIGDRFRCTAFSAAADVDCTGTLVTMGAGHAVDEFKFVNFSRPLFLDGTGGASPAEGGWIGRVHCAPFIRGVRVDFMNDWYIGEIICDGASAGASFTNGHNAVLIQGCSNWHIGRAWSNGAGEHHFRIGGGISGYGSSGWTVGVVDAVNPGGCGFKINDANVRTDSFSIGDIIMRGAFPAGTGRNREAFRATKFSNGTVGRIFARKSGSDHSCFGPIALDDGYSLRVGSIDCEDYIGEAFHIRGAQDGAAAGAVYDVTVGYQRATGGARMFEIATTADVGNIFINDGYFDQTDEIAKISGPPVITGPIVIRGFGAAGVTTDGVTQGQIDTEFRLPSGRTVVGDVLTPKHGTHIVTTGQFDPANVSGAAQPGFTLNALGLTAAQGLLGAGVQFARPGASGRRGAAIVPVQTGTNQYDVGVSIYAASGSTATDTVVLGWTFGHDGNLKFERAQKGIELGTSGPRVFAGTGSPEGVHVAPVGSLFLRSNGGAATSFYVKESGTGNTGWVAK